MLQRYVFFYAETFFSEKKYKNDSSEAIFCSPGIGLPSLHKSSFILLFRISEYK